MLCSSLRRALPQPSARASPLLSSWAQWRRLASDAASPLDTPRASSAPSGPRLPPASLSLSSLRDNPGASRLARRKGRGEGSGMGKTAGRGMKGTTARQGGSVPLGFEGGQTPLWRRMPKIGPMPRMFARPLEPLNLDKLQLWVDQGRIDVTKCVREGGEVGCCGIAEQGAGSERGQQRRASTLRAAPAHTPPRQP